MRGRVVHVAVYAALTVAVAILATLLIGAREDARHAVRMLREQERLLMVQSRANADTIAQLRRQDEARFRRFSARERALMTGQPKQAVFPSHRGPRNTVRPSLSGTATVGQTLTCSTGTWSGSPSYTYTWQDSTGGVVGWVAIGGQTAATYVIASGEAGMYLRCSVRAKNSKGASVRTTAPTSQVPVIQLANIWINTTAGASPSRCSTACVYNATNAYGPTACNTAYQASSPGDTIALKGGSYPPCEIDDKAGNDGAVAVVTFTAASGEAVDFPNADSTLTADTTLPSATIPVADTSLFNFAPNGLFRVWIGNQSDRTAGTGKAVSCQGKSTPSGPGNLTTCSSGTGTWTAGTHVMQIGGVQLGNGTFVKRGASNLVFSYITSSGYDSSFAGCCGNSGGSSDNILLDHVQFGSLSVNGTTNMTVQNSTIGPCDADQANTVCPVEVGGGYDSTHPLHDFNFKSNVVHNIRTLNTGLAHVECMFIKAGYNINIDSNTFYECDVMGIFLQHQAGLPDMHDVKICNNWLGGSDLGGAYYGLVYGDNDTSGHTFDKITVCFNSFTTLNSSISQSGTAPDSWTNSPIYGNDFGGSVTCSNVNDVVHPVFSYNVHRFGGSTCGGTGEAVSSTATPFLNDVISSAIDLRLAGSYPSSTADNRVNCSSVVCVTPDKLGLPRPQHTNAAAGATDR